ncbi:MAG: MATE family efflux transporter [Clostridia bacterium]|nr:MATE family efflux transporter [Clostridia bacterium]
MEQNARSKMLGTMKMSRLIPKVSVPIMISLLVQAMYNIIDSIFVAQYDSKALTAVSLAYPIQMLMIAVSTGLGTGINSLVSRKLGERKNNEALICAGNGVALEFVSFIIFLVFGLFFATPTFNLLTKDSTLRNLGGTYLGIVCTFSVGLFLSIAFERLMQCTGNTVLSMITQLTGAITNIILDPIMIFGYFGFPEMGVTGAAYATVIGQCAGMTLGFFLNQKKNKELKLSLRSLRIHWNIVKNILTVGIPSIIMQSISTVMNLALNAILITFGETTVSVLGVYFKLQSFVFMPVFGLSNGLIPIIGYNYGAKNRERVYSAIKTALIWALSIMAVGMVIFMAFPELLLSMFESGKAGEITKIGKIALRIICINFIPAGIGITLSTVFQAIGKGVYSMIMSLCRQLVILVPSAWFLARVGGLNAVWWSFVIAECVSLVISLLMYRNVNRRVFKWMQ